MIAASSPLRIGFIGAGGNTRLRHLPGFAAIEGVELAAVANRSIASAQSVAVEFGIFAVKDSWRDIVADPAIDAVCIGTWPDTHAELTHAALEAGKHVLVEARMARTLVEAKGMLEKAKMHPGLVAQIVPAPFSLDVDRIITDLIGCGHLGEIREIVSEFRSPATADSCLPLGWRMDERISGINTMALGICYEALLRWFPGEAKVIAADAQVFTQSRTVENGRTAEVKIPESLTVLGRWQGGARLIMHQSSIEHGPGHCRYRIVGSKAVLEFDVNTQLLTKIDAKGVSEQIEFSKTDLGGWRVEQQFVDSIRQGAPVELTNFSDGVRYMEFTDSAWNAWQD